MNSILKKYKDLKDEITRLEEKKKNMEEIVISILQPLGGSCQTPFGLFTIVTMRSWTYSDEVSALKELLKHTKQLEELQGTARLLKTSQHVRVMEGKK